MLYTRFSLFLLWIFYMHFKLTNCSNNFISFKFLRKKNYLFNFKYVINIITITATTSNSSNISLVLAILFKLFF